MVVKHREAIYGLGCITTKETRPGHHYLYAEWSNKGRRYCKSCGNASDPKSRQRALDKLREATRERIADLQRDLDQLQKDLKLDTEDGPPGRRSRT